MLHKDSSSQQRARDDIAYVTGSEPKWSEQIFRASGLLSQMLERDDFVPNRRFYHESGLPVMNVEGIPHIAAEQTFVMFNNDPMQIAPPGTFYRQDIAGSALAIQRATPYFELDLPMLLEIMVANTVPPRAVLAGGNARDLAIGVRGDAEEAIEQILELSDTRQSAAV